MYICIYYMYICIYYMYIHIYIIHINTYIYILTYIHTYMLLLVES